MMNISHIKQDYYDALIVTDEKGVDQVIDKALGSAVPAEDLVMKVIIPTIREILIQYIDKNEISLATHFVCTKIAEKQVERLIPIFDEKQTGKAVIIIGCAKNDFHGLGKKIVGAFLKTNGYEVYDVGLNVSPEFFVEKAMETQAAFIGVSSMMVHTAVGEEGGAGVRRILKDRNLENDIKLIVGGAPFQFDKQLYLEAGADAYAVDALQALDVFDSFYRE